MGNGEASEVPSKLKTVILNVSWTTEGLAINPLEPELQRGSPALRRGKAILEVPLEAEACAVGVGRLFTKRPWRGWQGEWTQRTVKGPSSLKALRRREPQPCAGISLPRGEPSMERLQSRQVLALALGPQIQLLCMSPEACVCPRAA